MKKTFLFAGIFSMSSAFAQNDNFFDIEGYLRKKSADEKNRLISPPLLNYQIQKTNPFSLFPRTDNFIILPTDNMPCLITDLNTFKMPNVFDPKSDVAQLLKPGSAIGKMPNAGHGVRIIPSK